MKIGDTLYSNEKLDLSNVEKYLRFLLVELDRYKNDWEISKDEFNSFKIELTRFKQIINNSNSLPEPLKEDINKISVNGKNKTLNFLRYLFLWDAVAFRKNQLEDKNKIELLEYDIRSILSKHFLVI
jgi:hypothetical protein